MIYYNTNKNNYIYYFAYGSNLNPKILLRRKIIPLQVQKVILRDYKIIFNIKGYFFDPWYANIIPSKGDNVEGVMYKINKSDFDTLTLYEIGYNILEVSVHLVSDIYINALTFNNNNLIHDNKPSKRYLQLIVDGAVIHQLGNNYIKYLQNRQSYDLIIMPNFIYYIIELILRIMSCKI
jgi:hypothetical protein